MGPKRNVGEVRRLFRQPSGPERRIHRVGASFKNRAILKSTFQLTKHIVWWAKLRLIASDGGAGGDVRLANTHVRGPVLSIISESIAWAIISG